MTDKLKRLREWCETADCPSHADSDSTWNRAMVETMKQIDRLLAEEPAQPVTDAEVEAAIETHADDWHHAGILMGQRAPSDDIVAEQLAAKESQAALRELIARKVAEASARAEALADAAQDVVDFIAPHEFDSMDETFRPVPNKIRDALAAYRRGGAS